MLGVTMDPRPWSHLRSVGAQLPTLNTSLTVPRGRGVDRDCTCDDSQERTIGLYGRWKSDIKGKGRAALGGSASLQLRGSLVSRIFRIERWRP